MRSIPANLFPHMLCAWACCIALLSGCSGQNPTAGQANSPTPAPPAPAPEDPPAALVESSERARGIIHTDADGRKWIDDVPLDVFFDDPLAIAGQTEQVAVAPTTTESATAAAAAVTPTSAATTDDPAAPAPSNTGEVPGAQDWAGLISAGALEDEVKSTRNSLGQNLQTLGNYNLSYLTIPSDATILAVLAQVAQTHSGNISWKDKSPHVRELALKIAKGADGRGRKAYDAAKLPLEMLEVVLSGGTPAGLEEPVPDVAFSDIAEMTTLMKRIDRGSKWLKTNTANEATLKERQTDAAREAGVLAALAELLGEEGYGYADDPEFLKHSHELRDASTAMVRTAGEGDFSAYDAGLSRAFNSCTACHNDYRQ